MTLLQSQANLNLPRSEEDKSICEINPKIFKHIMYLYYFCLLVSYYFTENYYMHVILSKWWAGKGYARKSQKIHMIVILFNCCIT